jgi:hypothetical protein
MSKLLELANKLEYQAYLCRKKDRPWAAQCLEQIADELRQREYKARATQEQPE